MSKCFSSIIQPILDKLGTKLGVFYDGWDLMYESMLDLVQKNPNLTFYFASADNLCNYTRENRNQDRVVKAREDCSKLSEQPNVA